MSLWPLLLFSSAQVLPFSLAASTAPSSLFSPPIAAAFDGISNASATKPNIVVILTDDQDLHLGSLNYMPNLQSLLVEKGLTFNNHYCSTSLCCPSRATLWTGKHAHNTNVTAVKNNVAGGAWRQVQRLGWYKDHLGVWMQQEGYNTYYAGKVYNGIGTKNYCKPYCLQGWTMGDFLLDPRMYSYYDSTFVHLASNGTWRDPSVQQGYSTDIVTENMLTYIDDALAAEKPFFAVAAPVACHLSGPATYAEAGMGNNHSQYPYPLPKKKYSHLYPELKIPRTDNFNPYNRTGVAGVWKLDQLTQANVDDLDRYYRIRQQTLKSVDDMINDVVIYLDKKGILNNTYIIYTSDNGFHLGNHRLQAGKEQCFEEDINVPFIVRGPGVAMNKSTDLVTGHIDLAPTILGLAGASLDHKLDGAPITFPLESNDDFQRNQDARGDFVHVEYWGPFHQEGMNSDAGVDFNVNLQTYKALRIQGNGVNLLYSVWCQDGAHELYDMSWDPYQMTNLHPDAPVDSNSNVTKNAYSLGLNTLFDRPTEQVITRLDALVLVEKTCIGDVCRQPWKQLHPNGNVTNLLEAMSPRYDNFYANSYTHAKVGWQTCYTGYDSKSSATLYDLDNERPNWLDVDIVKLVQTGGARHTTSEIGDIEVKLGILGIAWVAMVMALWS